MFGTRENGFRMQLAPLLVTHRPGMQLQMAGNDNGNYEVFRDCFSAAIIGRSKPENAKSRKRALKSGKASTTTIPNVMKYGELDSTSGMDEPTALADFIDVWLLEFCFGQYEI